MDRPSSYSFFLSQQREWKKFFSGKGNGLGMTAGGPIAMSSKADADEQLVVIDDRGLAAQNLLIVSLLLPT